MSRLDDLKIDAPVPRPHRRRHFPWLPVIVVLFTAALVVYFQRDRLAQLLAQPAATTPSETADQQAPQPAQPATRGPAGSISAAGYLEVVPPGPTMISALVSGRIDEVTALPGEAVAAGDVVARLDTGSLSRRAAVLGSQAEVARSRLELKQAGFREQEIEQAAAALRSAEAMLELASADWQRSQQLFDRGVIARQELDAGQAALRRARAAVDDARARLELLRAGTRAEDLRIYEAELARAQAQLAQVQWDIAQCTLRAPQDGVVLEQLARPGDWVTPGTDDPRSAAVLSVFDPSMIQAWVDVNQRDSGALVVGQPVELTTDALPERIVAGTVSRIMPQANLQKNTVQVKIAIADPPADFRPQLSVKVLFLPDDSGLSPVPARAGDEEGDLP